MVKRVKLRRLPHTSTRIYYTSYLAVTQLMRFRRSFRCSFRQLCECVYVCISRSVLAVSSRDHRPSLQASFSALPPLALVRVFLGGILHTAISTMSHTCFGLCYNPSGCGLEWSLRTSCSCLTQINTCTNCVDLVPGCLLDCLPAVQERVLEFLSSSNSISHNATLRSYPSIESWYLQPSFPKHPLSLLPLVVVVDGNGNGTKLHHSQP